MTGSVEQLRGSLDRVLEASLERLGLGYHTRQEMVRLRQRLDELESLVTKLDLEVSHEHSSDGKCT